MSLRFVAITSLLLLAIASTLFTSFHCKGGKNVGIVAAASDEEVRPKNNVVYAVAATAATRNMMSLRNRKMVVDKTIILNKNVMAARGTNHHASFRRITLSGNKNVNFDAFTQDYHSPRHHPPKNN